MGSNLLPSNHTLAQFIANIILKLIGWQVVGVFPDIPKFILVGAPHTSNWDFPLTLLLMYATGVRFNWIGKDSLFHPPFDKLFRRLGGIPVWRDRRSNFVSQIVEAFDRSKRLIIAIAPEGTRSKIAYWKTGFYYMALGAKVPLVLGFIDYGRRQVGVGPSFLPSGDIQADFCRLRDFYADKTGLYPEKQGTIEIRPE
jgi:1-acyl-sn-glycerol-3-phosphate acyltransferase